MGGVVAEFFVHEGPCDFVGHDFALAESFDCDGAVHVFVLDYAALDGFAHDDQACCEDCGWDDVSCVHSIVGFEIESNLRIVLGKGSLFLDALGLLFVIVC